MSVLDGVMGCSRGGMLLRSRERVVRWDRVLGDPREEKEVGDGRSSGDWCNW